MTGVLNDGRLHSRVREIVRTRRESEWVEFKINTLEHEKVAEYISAIANAAAIEQQAHGFVVWGVSDDGTPVGTEIDPWTTKVGNEDLIPWLRRTIRPEHAAFDFRELRVEDVRLVVLVIDCALNVPVRKGTQEYVRIGSYNKPLATHPEQARRLWRSFDRTPFELRHALEGVTVDEALRRLDVDGFARLMDKPVTGDQSSRFRLLEDFDFVQSDGHGRCSITNLGALCIARQLNDFPSLGRKAVRFVRYTSTDSSEALDAIDGRKGYLLGFEGLLDYIKSHLPRDPETYTPRRISGEHFPEIAVREIVANALIHQDLSVTGASPLIELFADRLEVSNPGAPLEPDHRRLLDTSPRSRNEKLAQVMRLAGVCEERGRGLDKAVLAAETARVPAPEVRAVGEATRATILGPRDIKDMTASERQWTTYMHTAVRHLGHEATTNSTLRKRFGLSASEVSKISRLIGSTVEVGLIKAVDPDAGPRSMRYVPFWA